MRYIGNKAKLLDFIEKVMITHVGALEDKTFCDLFSGTTTVARHFKQKCQYVMSNDLERYSYVLAKNYVENNETISDEELQLIERLNCLQGKPGLFTETLSPYEGCERMFFTVENAQKLDSMRKQIAQWYVTDKITNSTYFFLLASLLESIDKFANTTGVYGAYLKQFNGRSTQDFVLEPAKRYVGQNKGTVYLEDANTLLPKLSGDILYLDPPYNARQYAGNYHILNYIVNNKVDIKLNKEGEESKTGLPNDYNKSPYSQKSGAKKAFEDLLSKASGFKWVFLSYNDEGILSLEDIKSVMEKYGEYHLTDKNHLRYNSGGGKVKEEEEDADKGDDKGDEEDKTPKKKVIEYVHVLKIKE